GRTNPRPRGRSRRRVVPLAVHATGDPRLLRPVGRHVAQGSRTRAPRLVLQRRSLRDRVLDRFRRAGGGAERDPARSSDGGPDMALASGRGSSHRSRVVPYWASPGAHPRPAVLDEAGGAEEARLPRLGPVRRVLRGRLDALRRPDPGQHARARRFPTGVGLSSAARVRLRARDAVPARRPLSLPGVRFYQEASPGGEPSPRRVRRRPHRAGRARLHRQARPARQLPTTKRGTSM
ncbi:MAG: Cytochrome c-type biogenesis protein CcdA (DsbD analog), partial [uncultured Rubrobacteraceae bacterium]